MLSLFGQLTRCEKKMKNNEVKKNTEVSNSNTRAIIIVIVFVILFVALIAFEVYTRK